MAAEGLVVPWMGSWARYSDGSLTRLTYAASEHIETLHRLYHRQVYYFGAVFEQPNIAPIELR